LKVIKPFLTHTASSNTSGLPRHLLLPDEAILGKK